MVRGLCSQPRGPREASTCPEEKLARDKFCRSIALTAGAILKEEKRLSCGGEAIWEAFKETIWARVIASQKMPRGSGESIFAARH